MSDNIQVAVRVRPFNNREKALKTKCIVRMDDSSCTLELEVTKHAWHV